MSKEELIKEINLLKKEKNAVIFAHYYQASEIQDIADYIGDSLALAQKALNIDADIIVFCGVDFMGETAKILVPEKKVLIPVKNATCQMASMIDKEALENYKKNNPDTVIMVYVNSKAEIKALADVCVTSTNALKIIEYYAKQNKQILYCPDQNLGKYAMSLIDYHFDVWSGYCAIHNNLSIADVKSSLEKHPNALFIAHPECPLAVLKQASYVGSTKQLIEYVTNSSAQEFIIGTEMGVIHAMEKRNPNKEFYPLSHKLVCHDMKLTTLENLLDCLKKESNEVVIEKEISVKAKKCLDKMLMLS